MLSRYRFLDTPSLLVDNDIALENLKFMQNKADTLGVSLRPHTKTHRMPYFAKLQVAQGAVGITVPKSTWHSWGFSHMKDIPTRHYPGRNAWNKP